LVNQALDPGTGSVQEKEKAYLVKIIAKVNDLFEGELSDDDRLVVLRYVCNRAIFSWR